MFDNLGQMMGLMKKAGEIQSNLAKMKEELGSREYAASSGGDAVQVVVSGDFQLRRISIADAALKDRELLEDLILTAANNALLNAKVAAQEELKKATGGLNIPGLF